MFALLKGPLLWLERVGNETSHLWAQAVNTVQYDGLGLNDNGNLIHVSLNKPSVLAWRRIWDLETKIKKIKVWFPCCVIMAKLFNIVILSFLFC